MAKLEPCPFCGSDDVDQGAAHTYCFNCGGCAPNNIWNTRAPSPEHAALLERLADDEGMRKMLKSMYWVQCEGYTPEEEEAELFKRIRAYLLGGAGEKSEAPEKTVRCRDCGLPYSQLGLDLTLPDQQWKVLFPEGGGVLCANCICKRAEKLRGATTILGWIDDMDYEGESREEE